MRKLFFNGKGADDKGKLEQDEMLKAGESARGGQFKRSKMEGERD